MADEMVKYVLDYDKVLTPQAEQDKMTKRSQKMMETLYADIDTEIANVGKNVFALFNGVTRYTTYHQKPPTREGGNAESLIVGVGYKKAIDALEFCTEKCGLV